MALALQTGLSWECRPDPPVRRPDPPVRKPAQVYGGTQLNSTPNMSVRLCVLVTFAWRLSVCVGSFVPCEPCDQKALSMCPPVPVGCQLVKEPGCGCCLTCALSEGQACGVYTGTCSQGLRCLPRSGEEKPLHALLHGRGLCTNEKGYKPAHPPLGKSPAEPNRTEGPEHEEPKQKQIHQ